MGSHSLFVEKNVDGILRTKQIKARAPGLTTMMYPGRSSLPLTRRNLATGGLMPVTGAPVPDANSVRCVGNANYFTAGQKETLGLTALFWARRADTSADTAHAGVVFAGFEGAAFATLGIVVYYATSTALRLQAYQQTAGVGTSKICNVTPVGGTNIWKRYAVIVDPGGQTGGDWGGNTLKCETDSLVQSSAYTDARLFNTQQILVGAAPSSSFQASIDIGPFALHNVVLTQPEMDAEWAQMAIRANLDGLVENT